MKNISLSLYKELKETALQAGNRKYILLLIAFGLLVFGLGISGYLPLAAAQYSTFVGGITLLYGVYCGANVGSKWSPATSKDQEAVALAVTVAEEKGEPLKPVPPGDN